MKAAIFLLLVLLSSGCAKEPGELESYVLEIEPMIDYYSLDGATGNAGEAFFVASGGENDVKKKLNDVVVGGETPDSSFTEGYALNFVVFRGVFGTGGHGISVDRIEKTGNTFVVHATYSDPGKGMMVTQAFTQPVAIVPLGGLPIGDYEAKLLVTTTLKNEDGDSITEEDVEHASISFVVR